MRVLGAILAGGQSRRFGSDKAEAVLRGKPLLLHAADALVPQVDAMVVVGRAWPEIDAVNDLPEPGLGPLGGLAGALDYGARHGFNMVLTTGCDVPNLPATLRDLLMPGPAIADAIPIIGLWPVQSLPILRAWMNDPRNRSVYRFADHVGARRVALPSPIININRLQDLP
jgi:molybdenum cofactor guanylyltransferase